MRSVCPLQQLYNTTALIMYFGLHTNDTLVCVGTSIKFDQLNVVYQGPSYLMLSRKVNERAENKQLKCIALFLL